MGNVRTQEELTAWLVDWISHELEMATMEIDTARSLLEYSLSSVTATILVGDLEDWLDLRLSPTLVWDYPSIDAMTEYLLSELGTEKASVTPTTAASTTEAEEDPAKLLENLDALSEDEIDALLAKLEKAEIT
jgi:acyl carrier protein